MVDTSLIKKLHILGIIPARGNSKGVKSKNKKLLCGIPLVSYTIQSALNSEFLSRIMVSTEDPEIANISRNLGAEVPFLRPKHLSQDKSSLDDVISNVIQYYEDVLNWRVDIIVILLPTSPFRYPGSIDTVIRVLIEGTRKVGAVMSIQLANHRSHPKRCFILSEDTNTIIPLYNDIDLDEYIYPKPLIFRNLMSISAQWVRFTKNIVESSKDKVFWADYSRLIPNKFNCLFGDTSDARVVGVTSNNGDRTFFNIISVDIDEPIDFILSESIIENGLFSILIEKTNAVIYKAPVMKKII
ncbi:MAG TPA: acylneuraminate cytidylyltransferase family protein [Deltaproteobacteria bacterium]|nr:acylneuraminate cytidylyltransferase family protein [Deltaproteobacteria bacterium]